MDTGLTPAQMAERLADQMPGDAPLRYAESYRDESIARQRHGDADYWSQVADLLADERIQA